MAQYSTVSSSNQPHSFGTLLKQWRDRRGFSQLDLAIESGVSQRHISFIESGRAKPSRKMILELAIVLEIPLRQQNLMLTAAGFAPVHSENDLSSPEMASIRKALDFILKQQEPLPAIIIDRYWNLLLTNNGTNRLLATFIDPSRLRTLFYTDGTINLMRVIFHSQGLRPFIANWEEFAGHLLGRLHREASSNNDNDNEQSLSLSLFDEIMNYSGVSEIWNTSNRTAQNTLLLTIHLKKNDLRWQFFSTITTLGTPYDITLQELRIECLFPADEATERDWKPS
ncbi:MAG: helix-turn-helix transcriptional regulator [Leptolyngbyaceae cyanobacterium SU_3_3]|nr:helix-turn-helix transcriptional regulator [Leptolyngbyaceae cyanobacterium SU_3_3]